LPSGIQVYSVRATVREMLSGRMLLLHAAEDTVRETCSQSSYQSGEHCQEEAVKETYSLEDTLCQSAECGLELLQCDKVDGARFH
jgi:hypothetical protein